MHDCSRKKCSNYNNEEIDEIKYYYNNKAPSIFSRKVGINMPRKSEKQNCDAKSRTSRQSNSKNKSRNSKSNNR